MPSWTRNLPTARAEGCSEPALPSPTAAVRGAGLGEGRAKIIQEPEGGGGGEMKREVRNSSSGKEKPAWKITEFKISEGRKGLSGAHWGA